MNSRVGISALCVSCLVLAHAQSPAPSNSTKDEAQARLPKLRLMCDPKTDNSSFQVNPKNCRIGSILPPPFFGDTSDQPRAQSLPNPCRYSEDAIRMPKREVRNDEDVQIFLSRGGVGYGPPEYSIFIFGNGDVMYEGRRNVRVLGKRELKISKNQVRQILQVAKKINFYGLCSAYGPNADHYQSTLISINSREASNRVHDFGTAPRVLGELADQIEEMAAIRDWGRWAPTPGIKGKP